MPPRDESLLGGEAQAVEQRGVGIFSPGPAWQELAEVLARRGASDLVDLFVERRLDVVWRSGEGGWQQTVLQDGAAVRYHNRLTSSDGGERVVLADLLGMSPRELPALDLPSFPDPPDLGSALPTRRDWLKSVRYVWRWCAVVRPREATFPRKPALLDLGLLDGSHEVLVWPCEVIQPPRPVAVGELGSVRPGPLRVLLAPAAAAVLLHELLGHPLESDLRRRTVSWASHIGDRVCPLGLTVVDDPTAVDLPGSFDRDDEGTPSRPRVLVQDGVLVGTLGSLTEPGSGDLPAGNARRATVHTPPRPRISNLLSSVPASTAELSRHDTDVEVRSVSSGSLDPRTGVVVLHVREAVALRKGQIIRAVHPFVLAGAGAAVCSGLLASSGLGEACFEPGWCGKEGEVVPTGSRAPWLLLEGLHAL
jgi:hypothetical protein